MKNKEDLITKGFAKMLSEFAQIATETLTETEETGDAKDKEIAELKTSIAKGEVVVKELHESLENTRAELMDTRAELKKLMDHMDSVRRQIVERLNTL